MSYRLTPYYKRIVKRQIASGRFADEGEVIRHSLRLAEAVERTAGPRGSSLSGVEDLEEMLLDGLRSGPSVRMTPERRKRIYQRALDTK